MNILHKIFLVGMGIALIGFTIHSASLKSNEAKAQMLGATPALTVPQGGTGWGNIQSGTYLTGNGTGKLSTSTCADITGSADLCDGDDATGAGSVFPFTSVAGYNSTSTTLAFLNGYFSTASSTQSGNFYLPALTQGFSFIGSAGKVDTIASSSVQLSWFNNDSGFTNYAWPFDAQSYGVSTSTTIGFLNGLFSTASSTFSGPFRLSALSNGGLAVFDGLVTSGATTTAGTGLTYSGNAFNVNTSQNIATLSNLTDNGFVKTGSGNGTLSVDTTTYESGLTAGDGLTRTANDFDCDTASGSVFGCLSSANWTTFNDKLGSYDAWTHPAAGISATTSEMRLASTTSYGQLLTDNVIATSTTATSTFPILSALTKLLFPFNAALTTPVQGQIGIDTTSGQLRANIDGTNTRNYGNGFQYPAFTYSTSTAWTGTTTIPLGVASIAETWASVQCYSDTGTLNVSFYDGTNRMNMFNASTTIGTVILSTNNAFTAGETRKVDIGTPASTPTSISCTVKKSFDAD